MAIGASSEQQVHRATEQARLAFACLLMALTAGAPTTGHAQGFQNLGLLPGADISQAYEASSDGSVVVGYSGTVNGQAEQAFRWTEATGMVGLGVLPGHGFSSALAGNADGSVVVGDSGGEAFRWTAATGMVGLGFLSGGVHSQATGVSADGSVVVGHSSQNVWASVQAFRWTAATGMVGLGVLPGDTGSSASAVSANGLVVVGESYNGVNHDEAFRWTAASGMQGLGHVSGYLYSTAGGVNADGSVVVGFASLAGPGNQAFRWTASAGMVGLGFLPGHDSSQAFAVTGDGAVVVGQSHLISAGVGHAYLWDQVFGMQELKKVLTSQYGLDLAGAQPEAAYGISADGSTIVGTARSPNGDLFAFRANGLLVNRLVDGTYTVSAGVNDRIGMLGGSGIVQIGAGGSLSVAGNNTSSDPVNFPNSVFSGTVTGAGDLIKAGNGLWLLTGTSNFTGATRVDAGTLVVDGSIAASALTTVNAGATLGGNGIVGSTFINGGTLAPGSAAGSAFGPLAVHGNLSFTAASTYLIQVSPANAGRINVTGSATLGDATVNAVFLPGSYVNRRYTIVNATGGVTGTFNPAFVSNMPNLNSYLSYDANNAFLNINLAFVSPQGAFTVNQQNVANALTNYFNSNGSIPAGYVSLSPAGLTQAAGEVATGSQQTTFDAMKLFLGLLTDPFIAGRDGATPPSSDAMSYADETSAYAADGKKRTARERDAYGLMTKAPLRNVYDPRWNVWAAGFGGSQTTGGNAVVGSNNTTGRVFGAAAGADYILSPRTIAGFALAGGGTNFDVTGAGTGRSDLFQAGAFIRHTMGPAYLTGALAYGWQDITTDRTVTIAGVDRLRTQFNANAWSGRIEGGYRLVNPWAGGIGITPYAAGQFTTFDLPAYAEQVLAGSNAFALAYPSKSVTASRSELGVRTDKSWAMLNSILNLRGRFAWAHDFNIDRNVSAVFQALPGAAFVVNGAAQSSDAALVTASAEMKWRNGFSLAGTFEGEFSNVTRSYAGKGIARYNW